MADAAPQVMPRLIDPGSGDAIGLAELVDALDTADFDPRDEDSLAALGPLLARLGRNRDFLADLVIEELKQRCAPQARANSYGAQVFLLQPPNGRYVLRANFWPARDDSVVRASGTAPFFYDLPHDHNFSFLTVGYFGPGYWSDYYEFDPAKVVGLPGETAGLVACGRSRLDPGKLLLYRAHRDVHVQLPPDAFSVTLNILAYDRAQPWRDQFRFDIARDIIAEPLTIAPLEGLVALAAHFGGENGSALVHDLARSHPAPRMRVTALGALAAAAPTAEERAGIFETAIDDADCYVAGHARLRHAAAAQVVFDP